MKCPFCGYTESKVVDSRPTDDNERIRRRRECLRCQKRFTTYEVVETVPIIVIKKNGMQEPFDREKLLRGVLRALFGPLPELAGIAAREGHDVLLREVAVDGVAFHNQLVGRQGHGHVHHAEVPLHPGAAVEPQVALLQPLVVLHDFEPF